jgi:hypothetical protein
MHDSQHFFFINVVEQLRTPEFLTLIGKRVPLLHQYGPYSFPGGITLQGKREVEIWKG